MDDGVRVSGEVSGSAPLRSSEASTHLAVRIPVDVVEQVVRVGVDLILELLVVCETESGTQVRSAGKERTEPETI